MSLQIVRDSPHNHPSAVKNDTRQEITQTLLPVPNALTKKCLDLWNHRGSFEGIIEHAPDTLADRNRIFDGITDAFIEHRSQMTRSSDKVKEFLRSLYLLEEIALVALHQQVLTHHNDILTEACIDEHLLSADGKFSAKETIARYFSDPLLSSLRQNLSPYELLIIETCVKTVRFPAQALHLDEKDLHAYLVLTRHAANELQLSKNK